MARSISESPYSVGFWALRANWRTHRRASLRKSVGVVMGSETKGMPRYSPALIRHSNVGLTVHGGIACLAHPHVIGDSRIKHEGDQAEIVGRNRASDNIMPLRVRADPYRCIGDRIAAAGL